MRYGLSEEVISQINTLFAKHPQIEKVLLYGSRAKGNYKEGSDIDLSIVGDVDFSLLQKIENELDDLLLPYTVDLSVYSELKSDALIEHIDRVGIVFFGENNVI